MPDQEHKQWLNTQWRPMMGWTYMVTCIFDFMLFPIGWSILQSLQGGEITNQWMPITLHGAGLYHVAMGAVIGVTAWTRGQEKITAMNHGYPYHNNYGYEYERTYENARPVNHNPNRRISHPPRKNPIDFDEMPPRED